MKKFLYIGSLVVLVSVFCISLYSSNGKTQWDDVCLNSGAPSFCDNVGKDAYESNKKAPKARKTRLGKITGVTWKEKDNIIAVLGDKIKTAREDAYYYIIADYFGDPFLRQCSEVDVK